MTAHVLISGALFRAPEQRTSKAGKPFASATVRMKEGDGFQFWRVVVFSESAQAELMRLTEGDAISAQGALRVETYERDGQTKIGFSIIADSVLALRQPSRAKSEARKSPAKPAMSAKSKPYVSDDLNDPIPF